MTLPAGATAIGGNLPCRLCGGAQQILISGVEDPETRESFSILRCRHCGTEQTEPVPTDLGRYYSSQYHGGRHGFTASYCALRRLRWVNKFWSKELTPNKFRTSQGPKLLDVGCGEGTFLFAAQGTGWQVTGTEINPALARAQGFDVHSSLNEAEAVAPFDCITLWHSLEHMRDPRAVLCQLHGMLAPRGVLFIAVPNAHGWQARLFGARWLHRDVPRHLYHFGPASLRCLIEGAGFELLRSWHQEFEYDLMGWSQSALNAISPTPNLFFSTITGRPARVSALAKFASVAAGVAFSALALPLVPIGALAGAGGTLVVAARKKSE